MIYIILGLIIMKGTKRQILLLLFYGLIGFYAYAQRPYLSNLSADSNFPLYTTYAAAMERSNFILDEGYHFQYYIPNAGADFITDTGGDIGIGFLMDGKWVYKIKDMHRPILIKASYPDMVVYEMYPFKDIKVYVSFLVYSSVSAILSVKVKNEGEKPVQLSVLPFMRKKGIPFREISRIQTGFSFLHEELPDSWTRSHNLPYVDSIRNYFSMLEEPDDYFIFYSESGEAFQYPFPDVKKQKSQLLFHGRAFLPGKVRFDKADEHLRLQLFPSDNDRVLITENVPVLGSNQAALTNDGYFRLDAGLCGIVDQYTIMAADAQSGSCYKGVISKTQIASQRNDIELGSCEGPQKPINVKLERTKSGLKIFWKENGSNKFDVYKRVYPKLYFEKIASDISRNFYVDKSHPTGQIVSYIIIAKDQQGNRSIHSDEVYNLPQSRFDEYLSQPSLQKHASSLFARIVGFEKRITLAPAEEQRIHIQRSVAEISKPINHLLELSNNVWALDHNLFLKANERLFSKTPVLPFESIDKEALYWSCNNMMRQVFYPPEGKSSYNYYVFSREPTWGWGHGGQVFHESITMLAYAYIDPVSAMNSQRVYKERQYPNGYINYRTGSYLDEIIEHNGQLTSSAPWYAWLNWEVYLITKDKAFLKEMYESSKKFYQFVVANRDSDKDGLCEWGGEAILESVRDALVAVWDQVGYPTNFESLDLNCMLVNEAKALEKMAEELSLKDEALTWREDYTRRSKLINEVFWDDVNGFYYNVNKVDHSFTFKVSNDLKRDEIIGFLPLWAGIATPQQAQRLVAKLTDTTAFWRKYGVPSLSAQDAYYNPKGYWNGPVWVEWNYLIMRGLLNYGYKKEAIALVDKICEGMIEVLKKDHNLWEFYSPDEAWGGYHKTYIWAGIINRMMMDVYEFKTSL